MVAVVTVTANPALDLYTEVEELAPWRKLRVAEYRASPGGGGVNVAQEVAALSGVALAVLPVGGLSGDELLDHLRRADVTPIVVPVSAATRRTVTVLDRRRREQYRLVTPGLALSEAEWQAVLDAAAALAEPGRIVVFSGSLPTGVPADFVAELGRTVLDVGGRFVVDTSGAALSAALSCRPTLIKPNQRELAALTGHDPAELTGFDPAAAAAGLVDSGRVGAVVVSLGAAGAVVCSPNALVALSAPPVTVENTTGAGDAMVGALVLAMHEGLDIVEAARRGVAAGTAVCLTHGPRSADPSLAARLLPQVEVRRLS